MPVRPTLLHRMALVSFLLFRKNLGNLREFFGQMVYRPPGKKLPVRLWVDGPITRGLINSSTFTALYDPVLNLDEVNQPFDVEGSTLLQSVI